MWFVSLGYLLDKNDPRLLARRLFNLDGYDYSQISKLIGGSSEFSKATLWEFMSLFDFSGFSIVDALRLMLRSFALLGEASETENILKGFSERYFEQSPTIISDALKLLPDTGQASLNDDVVNVVDNVFVLATSCVMLNGDLYNKNNPRKMTVDQYVRNLEGLLGADDEGNNGIDFPENLLRNNYQAIMEREIVQAGAVPSKRQLKVSSTQINHSMKTRKAYRGRRRAEATSVFENPEPLGRVIMHGVLERAVVRKSYDEQSKSDSALKWKSKHVSLVGNRLLFHNRKKQLSDADPQEFTKDLSEAILVRHCYGEFVGTTKKETAQFSLVQCTGRVWHFRTMSVDTAMQWIDTLNLCSAQFSPPPIPSGIGKYGKYRLPIYPANSCRPEAKEQKLGWQSNLLHNLREKLQDAKGNLEKEHLATEIKRFEIYLNTLRESEANLRDAEVNDRKVSTTIVNKQFQTNDLDSPRSTHQYETNISYSNLKTGEGISEHGKPALVELHWL